MEVCLLEMLISQLTKWYLIFYYPEQILQLHYISLAFYSAGEINLRHETPSTDPLIAMFSFRCMVSVPLLNSHHFLLHLQDAHFFLLLGCHMIYPHSQWPSPSPLFTLTQSLENPGFYLYMNYKFAVLRNVAALVIYCCASGVSLSFFLNRYFYEGPVN